MRSTNHHWSPTTRSVVTAVVVGVALAACTDGTAPEPEVNAVPLFGFGNGVPSGGHYNLNIIGVPRDKTGDMANSSGHRIFVPLWGNAKIQLCESGSGGECATVDGFQVLDGNATDGPAKFALPDPDPESDGTTVYSVFVRALGTPGGQAKNTTCGMGAGEDGVLGTDDDEEMCSVVQLQLGRTKGKSTFQNASKELLYVYADIDGDGDIDRVSLFDDSLTGYFWDYDNQGLKLAQFRFYPCTSTVSLDPGASISRECTLTGN